MHAKFDQSYSQIRPFQTIVKVNWELCELVGAVVKCVVVKIRAKKFSFKDNISFLSHLPTIYIYIIKQFGRVRKSLLICIFGFSGWC